MKCLQSYSGCVQVGANRIGPRTEPYGTPRDKAAGEDTKLAKASVTLQ